MNLVWDAILVAGAYLLGSIPHLEYLARLRRIEPAGDLHTVLWQKGGKPAALAGILLEFLKGSLPVILGRWMGLDTIAAVTAGLAAVCGQMWPIWKRFDGEHGNTIGIATVAALITWAMLLAIVPVIIGVVIRSLPRLVRKSRISQPIIGGSFSRSMPLAMLGLFLTAPPASWYFGQPLEIILAAVVLFVLIMVRRATAGLRADLETGADKGQLFLNRLLYDRPGCCKYNRNSSDGRVPISGPAH